MTYFTSYYALKQRGQLKAGETMLVMGLQVVWQYGC